MVSQEEIQVRAYFIWEAKGHPSDSALEDWLEAERVALARHRSMKQSVLALAQALGPKRLPPHVEQPAPAPAAAPVKKPATRSRKKATAPV